MGKIKTTIEFPVYVPHLFKIRKKDLPELVKRAFIFEQYREGKISLGKAAELLNKTKWELLAIMHEHQIPLNYDLEELEDDIKTMKEVMGDNRK